MASLKLKGIVHPNIFFPSLCSKPVRIFTMEQEKNIFCVVWCPYIESQLGTMLFWNGKNIIQNIFFYVAQKT